MQLSFSFLLPQRAPRSRNTRTGKHNCRPRQPMCPRKALCREVCKPDRNTPPATTSSLRHTGTPDTATAPKAPPAASAPCSPRIPTILPAQIGFNRVKPNRAEHSQNAPVRTGPAPDSHTLQPKADRLHTRTPRPTARKKGGPATGSRPRPIRRTDQDSGFCTTNS
mgnify:CR=1 FL=1